MSYLLNWGSIQNPIRQSDLNHLFESRYGCAKKFLLNKIYKDESKQYKLNHEAIFGILTHKIISDNLQYHVNNPFLSMIEKWEKEKYAIDFPQGISIKEEIEEYQNVIDLLFDSKEYKKIKENVIDVERSFLLEIEKGIFVAGTIDVIMKYGKGIACIDWKTGNNKISQWEMDHGYQSLAYCLACKRGEFFLTPDNSKFQSVENGEEYYNAWRNTLDKNKYNKWPKFFYAYIKDLLPAGRASTRQAKYKSEKKIANPENNIVLTKGKQKGVMLYEADTDIKYIPRFMYSIKTAKIMGDVNLFPESIGEKCTYCNQKERCLEYGINIKENNDDIINIMKELGIEE